MLRRRPPRVVAQVAFALFGGGFGLVGFVVGLVFGFDRQRLGIDRQECAQSFLGIEAVHGDGLAVVAPVHGGQPTL